MGKLTFGQTGYSYESDRVEIKVEGTPRCARCGLTVYATEEKKAAGKSLHARCLTCYRCHKSLTTSNYHSHDDQLLCSVCYKKAAASTPAPSGLLAIPPVSFERLKAAGSSGMEDTGEKWKNQTDPDKLLGTPDYHVEVDRGDPRTYTETWVACGNSVGGSVSPSLSSREDLSRTGLLSPNRILDDHTFPDTDMVAQSKVNDIQEQLRLNNLESENSVGLTRNSEPIIEPDRVMKDQIKEETNMDGMSSALENLRCTEINKDEAVCSSSEQRREFNRWTSVGGGGAARTDRGAKARARFQSTTTVDKDDPECCPSCGGRVYHAEEVMIKTRKWHKKCFKCSGSCGKMLVFGKYTEYQSSFYCESCYRKTFGRYGGARGPSSTSMEGSGQGGSMEIVEVFDDSLPSPLRREFSSNMPPTSGPGTSGVQYEPVTLNLTQPIKGAQEWTEAISIPKMMRSHTINN